MLKTIVRHPIRDSNVKNRVLAYVAKQQKALVFVKQKPEEIPTSRTKESSNTNKELLNFYKLSR